MLIDFQSPIRNAILIYLILVAILFIAKPTFITPEYHIFLGPLTIFLAIIIYFIMTALSIFL